jgi:hypothetical protein
LPVSGEQFVQTGQVGLSDDLVEYLKDQIAIGNLEPGERLVEEQIAQATSMSRTPVRQAARRAGFRPRQAVDRCARPRRGRRR